MKHVHRLKIVVAIVASILALSGVRAAAGDSAAAKKVAGDASALELYRKMVQTIRGARTLSYESEYVWESGGREIGRATYRVWLKKSNYARLESRSADGAKSGVIVLDGRRMWIYWPDGRPYIHASDSTANARDDQRTYIVKQAPKESYSIGHETSLLGAGMSMTVLDPSIFHGAPDPMEGSLESVRVLGRADVGGERCSVIEASFMSGERLRTLWISDRDYLPRKLEEAVRVKRDIVVRESWRDVVVNAKMRNETFVWQPPAGWTEYRLPTLEDGLLKRGSMAPDFDLPLLDGSRFRLAEQRGKVVWLVFWRLACPPCRVELPHLEALHRRYGGDGLAIIGFNFADDPKQAARFLREKAVAFPNIADTSAAAQELYYHRYQTLKGQSAVPLNYLIDREGKVVQGWYGYDGGDNLGERILRDLGLGR